MDAGVAGTVAVTCTSILDQLFRIEIATAQHVHASLHHQIVHDRVQLPYYAQLPRR
jgi:hypothetical protein